MASIVSGLFGLDKESIQQQIQQEQDAFARTYAQGGIIPTRNYSGAMLGQALGGALANRLFGIQDPRLKKVTDIENIMSDVQQTLGEDAQDSAKLYSSLAQRLADAGYGNEALQATEMARKANLERSQADSARIKAQRETKSEYQRLIDDLKVAEANGDTVTADFLKKRLEVLGTEGQTPSEPSTDKLKARYLSIMNDPAATPVQKEQAKSALNTLYQYTNLPAGFERDNVTGEVRPIAGGPQDLKLKEAEQAKFKALKTKSGVLASADEIFSRIDRLANPRTVGLFGTITKFIPGEPAADLKEAIQTIKARLSFDTLQEMRDLSKTGGALGNVSNQELKSLEASIASLEQSQSYPAFLENLRIVQRHYDRIKQAVNQDLALYESATAQTSQGTKPSGQPTQFVPGRRYVDKNGNAAVYNADGTWTPVGKGQ